MKPISVTSNGVISAQDDDGITHHYHTNPEESRSFAMASMCLAQGREELFLLLYGSDCPEHIRMRTEDGRSDQQLKDDWLTKVTRAGMHQSSALDFLERRLAC